MRGLALLLLSTALAMATVWVLFAFVTIMGFWYAVAMASAVAGLTAALLWASGHE